jgi:hypothetical protein
MWIKSVRSLVLIHLLAFFAIGQDVLGVKWTRVETEKKELSAIFPPGFLVDAEKRSFDQVFRIVGFKNGVVMEMSVEKDGDAKSRIKRTYSSDSVSGDIFKVDNLQAKRIVSLANSKTYFEILYVASGDRFFSLTVRAPSMKNAEVGQFLGSIKINEKQLYTLPSNRYPEELVAIKSLRTSPEVADAFDRKYEKHEIKVSYDSEKNFRELPETPLGIRPAIIVERPIPNLSSLSGLGLGGADIGRLSAKLVITFLANGQIGDIKVYSNSVKSFAKGCVDSAKKIKFVPAREGDKNVDFVSIENYDVIGERFTTLVTASGAVRVP